MAESIILNSVGARTQPCFLTPLVSGKASDGLLIGEDTLEAVVVNLHTGGSGACRRSSLELRQHCSRAAS